MLTGCIDARNCHIDLHKTHRIISERAQSCSCSIEISDTYVHIYMCGRTSSYMSMLNSLVLGNKKLRGPVVRNVGGFKFQPLSKAW